MISDDQLFALLGTWAGSEELLPTTWTSAGTAEGRFVIASVVPEVMTIDYTETREGSVAMTGHGVVTKDGWWWFDSYGFVPAPPGTARWNQGTLELERRSDRGRNVMRLARRGDALSCEILTAVPADTEPAPMLTGLYRQP